MAVSKRPRTFQAPSTKKRRTNGRVPRPISGNMPMVTVRRIGLFTGSTFALGPTSTWNSLALDFKLNYLPNFLQLTNMFEMYRVNWVKYHFKPTVTEVGPTDTIAKPVVYTCVDTDGEISIGTQVNMQSYGTAKLIHDSLKPFSLIFKPAAQVLVGTALAATGARPVVGSWIDTNNANVIHYGGGFGGYCPSFAASNSATYGYNIYVEASVSLKGTKPT